MRRYRMRGRIILGLLALAALGVAATAGVYAIQGDDAASQIPPEKAADATPTPTVVPVAESCPASEFVCDIAVEFGRPLRAVDGAALVGDANGFPVDCGESSAEPPDACDGAMDGVVDGFLFGGNHRDVLARDGFVAHLDQYLQSDASVSDMTVASIGCLREHSDGPLDCSHLFAVAYRASADTGPVVLAFRGDPMTGEANLFAILFESPDGAVIRGGFASLGLPFTLGLDGDVWWMPWEGP